MVDIVRDVRDTSEYYPPRIKFTKNLIITTVERETPQFAVACKAFEKAKGTKEEVTAMMMHQDAFASGYDIDELVMLGLCVKYAGLRGVSIMFMGRNHETF
jgi:hypothetical protein